MTTERPRRPRPPTTSLVTTGVVEGTPVFAETMCCEILLHTVASCQRNYGFEVLAFVLLPDRFRWIVHLGRGRATVSDVMRDLKNQSAREIMAVLEKEHSYGTLEVFVHSARALDDQRRRFWRPHFEETVIGDMETLRVRIEDLHEEPVREGIVPVASAYRYSSAWSRPPGDPPILSVTPISQLEWIV